MTGELFTVDPTPATPLAKARARLAKAEAELERTERLHDEQGPEAWYLYQNAKNELNSAKDDVRIEEMRALADMRASSEG